MIDSNLLVYPILWIAFTYFGSKPMAICTLMSLVVILSILLFTYVFKGRRVKKLLYAEAVLISLVFIIGGWWISGIVVWLTATWLVCIWDFPIATLDTK